MENGDALKGGAADMQETASGIVFRERNSTRASAAAAQRRRGGGVAAARVAAERRRRVRDAAGPAFKGKLILVPQLLFGPSVRAKIPKTKVSFYQQNSSLIAFL